MFFSLLQTLVCVLLVNSGLYALHLTGSAGGSGGSNAPLSNQGQTHTTGALSKTPASNPFHSSNQRLNEELADLADLAQLERERLMVMGLVKQTAEESGYHGRPIITGRIKMHPAEDMDSEYSAWLSQQARNVMFGNVVKQPLNDEEDYDSGGGGSDNYEPLRSTNKYDYGRIVQPQDREFENPHNLDLDDFMELEPVQEEEDLFPDMDGYAYIEELMAEENKERLQHHYQQQQQQQQQLHHPQMPQFPGFRSHHSSANQQQQQKPHLNTHNYQNHEPFNHQQQVLQDFFEKEQKLNQQQQQQQQQQHQFNNKYRNNVRMQQKWLRKRNQLQQQQQQLTRNIFGQKNAKSSPPLHHFKTLSSNKLSLANSEATATTRINKQNKPLDAAQEQQQQQIPEQIKLEKELIKEEKQQKISSNLQAGTATAAGAATNALNKKPLIKTEKTIKLLEPKPELLQQTNHKRSGLTPASLASSAGASSPHSLASQLMLRTARGQRQYDVPQIECPTAMDGMERFACPTPDVQGRYRCIDDHVLCDGFIDCPEGEDEDRRSCMFYKTTKAHLDVLADALLRWARGR
ncbi:low-density lipoprotein receptor domain-containing jelly belly protein isoform 1-T2 [Cochliomyia hominivorax]